MAQNKALSSWVELNKFLMSATEEQSSKLLQEELKGSKRKQYLLRIHSRVNKLRAHRERKNLKQKV